MCIIKPRLLSKIILQPLKKNTDNEASHKQNRKTGTNKNTHKHTAKENFLETTVIKCTKMIMYNGFGHKTVCYDFSMNKKFSNSFCFLKFRKY